MKLQSKGPHDFYLALDVRDYWEAEYEPETIVEHGYARPLSLSERDVLAVVRWNEDVEEPEFEVAFPGVELTAEEEVEAERQLRRILGTDLDTAALEAQASDDQVLGPLMEEHRGFKRVAKANLWEECVDDFVRSRIRHRPTARRMSQDVRRTWGTSFTWNGTDYYAYPRPEAVVDAELEHFREFGISRRKGEYIVGLAQAIASGEFDVEEHEAMEPEEFFDRIQKVRGIGPSTAGSLMHFRNRPDCVFMSRKDKEGNEKGLRRWFIRAYGGDPNETSDEEFLALISAWRGYEAIALRFMYIDWILSERKGS